MGLTLVPVGSPRDGQHYMDGSLKMTLGEYRVGISFNPGGNPTVNTIKRAAADLIDLVNSIEVASAGNQIDGGLNGEVARLKSLAITHIEDAAMWAVKAATKPKRVAS